MSLNSAQQATFEAILERPTRSDVRWSAIESLIRALGGTVTEGAGSRVRFSLNGTRAVFHRPHPRPVTGRMTLRDVRDFLITAGVVE